MHHASPNGNGPVSHLLEKASHSCKTARRLGRPRRPNSTEQGHLDETEPLGRWVSGSPVQPTPSATQHACQVHRCVLDHTLYHLPWTYGLHLEWCWRPSGKHVLIGHLTTLYNNFNYIYIYPELCYRHPLAYSKIFQVPKMLRLGMFKVLYVLWSQQGT